MRCPTYQRSRAGGFTLVELLVVIGIIALLISILLPALNRANEMAARVKCASNLRQIANAIIMYSNENGGHYPRTHYQSGASATYVPPNRFSNPAGENPFATPGTNGDDAALGVAYNDNSAGLFLLIRETELVSEVFLCPSARNMGSDDFLGTDGLGAGVAELRSNFSAGRNLGYGISNLYPRIDAVTDGYIMNSTRGASSPIMADRAPHARNSSPPQGGSSRGPAPDDPKDFLERFNSTNHARRGQNVLYGDGHVDWHTTVFAGDIIDDDGNRDNIYRSQTVANNNTGGGGNPPSNVHRPQDNSLITPYGTPLHEKDTIMLPLVNQQGPHNNHGW